MTDGITPTPVVEGEPDLIFKGRASWVALVGPVLSSVFWLLVSIVLFLAGPLGERIGKSTEVKAWSNSLTSKITQLSESLKPAVDSVGTTTAKVRDELTSGTAGGKKAIGGKQPANPLAGFTLAGILVVGFNLLGCFFLLSALMRIFRAVWHWLSTSYRLTTHRIEIEKGIFSKCILNFELWRVQDINYTRSFWEFVFKVGRLHVKALDAGQEDVLLIGPIRGAREVYDRLKDARLAAGQRAGAQAMGVVG